MNATHPYFHLGEVAVRQKNFSDAVEWFTKALQEQPKDAQILACLGQSLCWQGLRKSGLEHLRQAAQILLKKARKTKDIQLVLGLSEQLHFWNDYQGALEICKQNIVIDPNSPKAFHLLAFNHARLNQNKSALSAARQALRLEPENPFLGLHLATLEIDEGLIDEACTRLKKLLTHSGIRPLDLFKTHKELARVFDIKHDFSAAFSHLKTAAQIAELLPEIQRQQLHQIPDLLHTYKQGFDRALLSRWSNQHFLETHRSPIFLVGFMRTGTTLTQEVLNTQPNVFVADETALLHQVIQEMMRMNPSTASIPDQLRTLTYEAVLHLRAFYWNKVHALFGNEIVNRIFIDKTTLNSIDVGALNCLFPDAKLLFLIRDPRDVCLSCFMQTLSPTPSTVHLFDWQRTAQFYAEVMDCWLTLKPRLSMAFREIKYEDAVSRFEETFRPIFEFLNLDWNPDAKNFHLHKSGKHIASPSFNQVTQPLYHSSVGRWKRYRSEFQDVLSILQPYIDHYHYDSG